MEEAQFRTEPLPGPLQKMWSRVERLIAGSGEDRTRLIETAAYRFRLKLQGIDLRPVKEHGYVDSGGPSLDPILGALTINATDSVVDLGCGKGGALLTLARYPFAKADGVEVFPELANAARANLVRAGVNKSIIFCCNAVAFQELDSYNFIYMYNPFPPNVLARVMDNLNVSVARRPRRLTVIFQNPVDQEVVVRAGYGLVKFFPHGLSCGVYTNQH